MHVQDYGNIAVFWQVVPFQDLLDTLRVERSVSFQALLDSFTLIGPLLFRLCVVVPLRVNLICHLEF